jgi:DNA-binding ferritin-like protein (Dps family)
VLKNTIMNYKISIALSFLLAVSHAKAGGLGNFLKQIDSGIQASADESSGNIKKQERKPPSVPNDYQEAYLAVKLYIDSMSDDDTTKIAIKKNVKDGDLCLAVCGVKMVTDFKPDDIVRLKDVFFLAKNENHDDLYSLTMMRPDGSTYDLISNEKFYSDISPEIVNTAKGDLYQRELVEKKQAAANQVNVLAEADKQAFAKYLSPSQATITSYEKKVDELKARGDLVFKKMYLGMPLSFIVANPLKLEVVRRRYNNAPIKSGETPDKLTVGLGESIIYEINFDQNNKYSVSNGVYYRGETPINDLPINFFVLDRVALNNLFDVGSLTSTDVIKKFCDAYKINRPALWAPKREYQEAHRGLGIEADWKSVYTLRDPSGFNLAFTCYDNDRKCYLFIQKTKAEKDINNSFN